jgi:hypothetical protein
VEGVPKELDESEDEFWSSDDELNNMGRASQTDKTKEYKPTPEFTPSYPEIVEEKAQQLSNEMFAYLIKVKQHGMFAVWTEGTDDIDLKEISESHGRPPPKLSSKDKLND